MNTDLTVGKPFKVIVSFSLPLLLSTALQQFYNTADSMIVGQYTGSPGLAAIGAAYPITLFFVAIATGASMGCSVKIAELFGARRHGDLKTSVFTTLIALSILGVVLAAAGILLSGPLMTLLNANSDIYVDAKAYLAIYSVGVLPMLVYNAATAVFTGLGDSRRPLYLLFMSSLLNIVLDIIAVRSLKMGVAGAAWATTISQLVAAVLSIILVIRRIHKLESSDSFRYFDRRMLGEMSKVALPTIFQQSCVALTHTIVQSILNTYDTQIIAGYEAASKLHNFAYMCFNTLGTALASFAAQCYGAKKYERVRTGFKISTSLCLGCTVVVIALFQLIPNQLLNLFLDGSQEALAIEAGVNFLRIISPVYLPICFIITIGGLLRGLGKSFTFFVETLIEFTVRVAMCFVLTRVLASYTGLMWAWYFGSSCGFIMCVALYFRLYTKGPLSSISRRAKNA